jgi:hypothetical protein
MIEDDHSVLDLLTARYTYVNEQLAVQYGIPGVKGGHFRRVELPADSPRGGLLGQGSILMVTSYADRTSPVLRGKWILENLLGTPPPPPPPNVPPLADTGGANTAKTMRQRMEQHRRQPQCAACHARMDPLGFALENFDAIGLWRTTEGNAPIDASSELPGGIKIGGAADLKNLLVGRRDEFAGTVTEKLMTYALGRGTEYYDAPVIRQILKKAAAEDYKFSAIIEGIVTSTPFQMRMSPPAENPRETTGQQQQ